MQKHLLPGNSACFRLWTSSGLPETICCCKSTDRRVPCNNVAVSLHIERNAVIITPAIDKVIKFFRPSLFRPLAYALLWNWTKKEDYHQPMPYFFNRTETRKAFEYYFYGFVKRWIDHRVPSFTSYSSMTVFGFMTEILKGKRCSLDRSCIYSLQIYWIHWACIAFHIREVFHSFLESVKSYDWSLLHVELGGEDPTFGYFCKFTSNANILFTDRLRHQMLVLRSVIKFIILLCSNSFKCGQWIAFWLASWTVRYKRNEIIDHSVILLGTCQRLRPHRVTCVCALPLAFIESSSATPQNSFGSQRML